MRMLRTGLLGAAILMLCSMSHAATATAPEPTHKLNIPAQPLGAALNALAAQTGMQIVLNVEDTAPAGIETPSLVGQFTSREALQRMLAKTGLKYEFVNERTVRIAPSAAAPAGGADVSAPQSALRLVRSEGRDLPRSVEEESAPASSGVSSDIKGIPEILVKGRHSANTGIQRTEDDVQPYVIYDRARIERSMAANLEDFLKTRLPMNTSQTSYSQIAKSPFGSTSSIDLRGLGSTQTLILVNGRRMAGMSGVANDGAFNQPDLNGIPLDAVERIEVLPSTASGIYGGGATGGVVNVILRQDYSGMEARATYENAFDTDAAQRRLDLNAGLSLEGGKTNITLTAGYSDANPLAEGDRDFAARGRALMRANDPSAFFASILPPVGYTSNIRNTVNAPLRLDSGTVLSSNITHVPVGYAGALTDGGMALVANAGRYNLDAPNDFNGARQSMISSPTVESAMLNVRREFGSRVEAFVDLSVLHNNGLSYVGSTRTVTLPASAPNNPFTTNVRVAFPSPGIALKMPSESHTRRGIAGVIVRLPGQWTGQLEYSLSRSESFFSQTGLSATGTAALASGELDVMKDLNRYPEEYPANYFPSSPLYVFGPSINNMDDVTLRAAGRLFDLPGGPLMLSGLLEDRKESVDGTFNKLDTLFLYYHPRSQQVRSGYAELSVPLVSARNDRPGLRKLEMQLSARQDRYKTNGVSTDAELLFSREDPIPEPLRATSRMTSTDYTFGVSYAPVEDLQLRASIGTGFLPPSVAQVVQTYHENYTLRLTDPARLGVAEDVVLPRFYEGGNPDLRPEESESLSAGLIFTPRAAPGLRLSIDYTRIEKTDEISLLRPDEALRFEELFPERVIRGPKQAGEDPDWAGPIVELNATRINVSKATVAAYDMQLDYSWETASQGRLNVFAIASHQTRLERQVLPDALNYNSVGYNGGPLSWRGSGGLTWEKGGWTVGWNAQFFDSYRPYAANDTQTNIERNIQRQGSASVPSQLYHDIFARYRFDAGSALLQGAEVMVGIRNLFDKSPPIRPTIEAAGGYSTYGDPRMRFYTLSLRKSFKAR